MSIRSLQSVNLVEKQMKFDYKKGLESSETLILTYTSSDLTLLEVSAGVKSVLGYEPEELVDCFYATFPTGSIYDREHKNGSLITCQAIASFPTENGHFMLETILKAEDFRDHKDVLCSQSSLLKSIMEEKTAAEIRAKAGVEFTSFLAHEVRNPLSGIDSTAQLICHNIKEVLEHSSDQPVQSAKAELTQAINDADHCLNCVKYIQTILSNTLDLTKLEAGKLQLQNIEMFLYKDIVSPSMTMLVSQKSDRVDVEVDCNPRLKIKSDLFRFSQVMTNILSNSFRFTKRGKVTVRARLIETPLNPAKSHSYMATASASAAATKWLRLHILDTGPHNAEMVMQDITKYSKRRYERQASSVGLNLAYKLTEALGGDMYFDPEYTGGCGIVIELPHCYEATEEDLQKMEATMYENPWDNLTKATFVVDPIGTWKGDGEEGSGVGSFTGGGGGEGEGVPPVPGQDPFADSPGGDSIMRQLRILIVDDSKAATKLMLRRLQTCMRGYWNSSNACVAFTAEQTLQMCETTGFDVIIIDENMQATGGVMLGHEAVRLMRQKLKMSSTVIIGCTGNADEAAREMFQAGADNVWGKPMPHTREMISDIAAARVARLGDGAAKLPGCKKLLIVDDSKVNCRVLIRRLRLALPPSWDLQSSACAEDVFGDIASGATEFDIIITDEYLGGPDIMVGSEFMRRLRQAGYRGILIGCSGDHLLEQHLACGADISWTKPPPSNEVIVGHLLHFLPRLHILFTSGVRKPTKKSASKTDGDVRPARSTEK